MPFEFDDLVREAVAELQGAAGQVWLETQAQAVDRFLSERNLKLMGYGPRGLAVNQICFVGDGKGSFVLKTGYPEPELFTEMRVLQHWRGREGCVQLLDLD